MSRLRLRGVRPRRTALLFVAVLIALQALAGAAGAAPNLTDCSPAPDPERPGAGLVGFLDDPSLGKGVVGSIYDEVSYAGLTWNTYGHSGICATGNPALSGANWTANQVFSLGKLIASAVSGIHWMIVDNTGLEIFDDFVIEMSGVLYHNVFVVLCGLVLMIASIGVLALVMRGDLAAIGTKTLFVLGGLWLGSTTFLIPMAYVNMTDNVLVRGTAELETSLLQPADGSQPPDLPTILHEQVVVQPWILGEFGALDSPEADRYARDLIRAQACTKQEAAANRCDVEAKKAAYKRIGSELETTPAASSFSGDAGRMGPAGIALVKALAMGSFQLFAKIGLLFLQVLARGLVVVGPVLGLMAMLSNTVFPRVGRALLLALSNGLILTCAGAGQTYLVAWITDPVRDLPAPLQVTLIAGSTVLLFMAIRPWRRLLEMFAATAGIQLPSPAEAAMNRRLRRMNRRSRSMFRRLGRLRGNVDSEWWMSPGEDAQPPPQPYRPGTAVEPASWAARGFPTGRPEGDRTIFVSSERVHAHGEHPRAGQVKRAPIPIGAGTQGRNDDSGGGARRGGPDTDPGGGGTGSGSGRPQRPQHPPRALPPAAGDQRSGSPRKVFRPEENSSSADPRRSEGSEKKPDRPSRPSQADGTRDARRVYRPADNPANPDPASESPQRPRPEGEQH